MRDIIAIAKEAGFKITEHRTGVFIDAPSPCNKAVAALIPLLEAEIRKEFEVKISNLQEMLIAAWEAHCDDEGYGPSNLMYRMERSISTSYPGYSAGAFQNLTEQNAKLMEALVSLRDAVDSIVRYEHDGYEKVADAMRDAYALTPQPEKEGKE